MNTAQENNVAVIVLTKGGALLGQRLLNLFENAEVYIPVRLKEEVEPRNNITFFNNWKSTVEKCFTEYSSIIFVMSAGIVVREIASHLQGKDVDPAVVVIDEKGNFPVSLLSGHLGGANALTAKIADFLGVVPVITTATDVNSKPAVDLLAKRLNCSIIPLKNLKKFNRILAEGDKITVYTINPDLSYEKEFDVRDISELDLWNPPRESVIITNRMLNIETADNLFLYPQNLVVGVGCRKGVSRDKILNSLKEVFHNNKLSLHAVRKIASLDLKKEEEGLLQAAQALEVPFETVSKEEILEIENSEENSTFVKNITGVGNVCEPAAKIASKKGTVIVPKQKLEGVTAAVVEEEFM